MQAAKKFRHLISLTLILILLAGCSNHKYFDVLPAESIVEHDGNKTVTVHNWQNDPISLLIENCFNTAPVNAVLAAAILSCNDELLSREGLAETSRHQALQHYNQALAKLVQFALQKKRSEHLKVKLSSIDDTFEPTQLTLLSDVHILDDKLQYQEFGELGVLAIAERRNSKKGQDNFYPLEGIFRSVNFLFDSISYTAAETTISLTYQVVSEPIYITKGNNTYVQKYSPSAAFLGLIEKADIDGLSLLGLLQAAKAEFRRGLFAIEPISATKIPLIMTHGLNSDPLIWRHLTMDLLNDADINKHFQIWHFYYPSGPPPFFTAMKLRKRLAAILKTIPNQNLAEKAVFVGHSMGGIITHVLTSESDYALWDSTFIERPEILIDEANPELENIFLFKPVFKDNTVFFLDTPHLGSEVATSSIGYITSWLVSLPYSFSNLFGAFIRRIGFDKLTPAMQPYSAGPNSIQVLRPGHPIMLSLSELPVAGRAYSIVGSADGTGCSAIDNCSNVSDSVVAYPSAHFPLAQEEIIVPSTHNSFESENAINFIHQKLLKMAQQEKQSSYPLDNSARD